MNILRKQKCFFIMTMMTFSSGDRLCHEFGTAEFVTYCRSIGAEPMICVNMPTGSAEEAGNWVEYCNGTGDTYYANLRRSHGYEEPFEVKYWCIGNESSRIATEGSRYGLARRYDWKCALWVAKFMNMMIRHSDTVRVANLAQMVNVIAPVIAERDGSFRQTIFYPLRDYRRYCGDERLSVEYDDGELDCVATVNADGERVLLAVNTSGEAKELSVNGVIKSAIASYCGAEELVNTLMCDHVICETLAHEDSSVTVPAISISIITLKS